MKKFLSLFLSIVMCLSLVSLAGCGGEDEQLGTYTEDEVIGEVVEGGNNENKNEGTESSGGTTTNKVDATETAYFVIFDGSKIAAASSISCGKKLIFSISSFSSSEFNL